MDVSSLVELKRNKKIPDIAAGDTVKVHCKIVEGDRERIQVFQGVVIKISKGGAGASFTVRHVAAGIGVERTFPFYSSNVDKVEIVRQGKVRRSRLYYLRGLSGKEARRKIKRVERKSTVMEEELLTAEPEEELKPEDVAAAEPEAVEQPAAAEPEVEEAVAEATVAEAEAVEETAAVAEETKAEEPVAEAAVDATAAVETAVEEEKAPEAVAEEAAADAVVEEAPAAEATEETPAAEEETKEDA